MSNSARLEPDDDYEDMAMTYQCLITGLLDEALAEAGVPDEAVRRKVCENFIFNWSVLHDQNWFRTKLKSDLRYPLLCFARKHLGSLDSIEDLGTVSAPSDSFDLHDSAFGIVASHFEEPEEADVEYGLFTDEKRD